MRRSRSMRLAAIAALVAVAVGCGEEDQPQQPPSLQAPSAMAVADGEVCLPEIIQADATFSTQPLIGCEDGGNGFGLVASQRSSRVGVVALGQEAPRMVNTDNRRPGITGIEVGDRPVDVTTSGGGTAAISANQADETLTGIDLWTLRPLSEPLDVQGTVKAVETMQGEHGESLLGILSRSPDQLEVRGGLVCERPDTDDRRRHNPDDNCEWEEVNTAQIDLPGKPVDMTVDAPNNRAWVIYRDLNALSWIAFDDEGLGEDDECIDGGAPPCEIDRVDWEEHHDPASPSARWGATKVDADPLGMFVYVMDRPNNQLLVFDRDRRRLINAAEAMEPPLAPLQRAPGISLMRSPTAMSAEYDRQILGDGHVLYRLGARVAATNRQVYRVGAVEVECLFDGGEPMSNDEFFFDRQARDASEEAGCLELMPELPLGLDPDFDDDEALLEERIVESDDGDVQVALTPIFALVDGDEGDGEIVRSQCDQPTEFRERLSEADTGEGIGCGTPLSPQPVGMDVDDEVENFDDEPRADLMVFARALFEDGEALIDRSVFDYRMFSEEWSVTYEGALPDPGRTNAGLVSDDPEGWFLSGGAEFCGAGVEEGDRLTIRTEPTDADGCEVFEEDAQFDRTWEISTVEPFDVELSVIDDEDYVDELPTRDCFDRGVDYEIRPVESWTVVGEDSGLSSPYERDGNECVLREGADDERSRIQSRVNTGEEFVGPYLRFRLREGDVEPVQGLEYTFETQRRFSPSSHSHVPEGRRTTTPSQVLFTPDLGVGRLLSVVDAGGDRVYLRNLEAGTAHFVR